MEAEEKKTQWFIGSLEQWPLNLRANAHRLAGKKQKVSENCVSRVEIEYERAMRPPLITAQPY
jgi:hypothetical protein